MLPLRSMRWFAPFCIGMFYTAVTLQELREWASLPNPVPLLPIACAMMWWIQDSAKLGRPLPLLSISVFYLWMPITIAVYVMRTRGWSGMPKLVLHTGATLLIMFGWMHPAILALQPVPRPSAEQLARWKPYGISSDVMSYVENSGTDLRPLALRQDEPHPAPLRGVMFEYAADTRAVDAYSPREFVEYLRRVAAPGEIPFVYEGASLAVARAASPYEVMRAAETNANNYDIGTEQIIARMQDWDRRYGVRFYGIGFDWLGIELLRAPDDVDAFAREVYEFCPDTVEQGFHDVAALAADIKHTRSVYLWWD